MSVKSQNKDFRSIMTDIRKNIFAPVYILMGEEPYYIDIITEALDKRVVPENERDFNVVTVYGQDANIPDVITACQQYPFMADRKLVLLKEAQSMNRAKSTLDGLAEYVLRPSDMNVLVICFKGDNLNANSRLLKAAAKSGAIIFRSPKLRDYQLDTPIKEYCRDKKISIQEKAILMLKESLGTSLEKIFSEIDKLIVAGGRGLSQITPELVERNIGISKDFNNIELWKAIGNKDYGKCMLIVKHFSLNPKQNPTQLTTAILFSYFSRLLSGLLTTNPTESNLISSMDLKSGYSLNEYSSAFRKYTPMQVIKAIHFLRDFDAKSKGINSNQNEYELLTELIYNIFTAK